MVEHASDDRNVRLREVEPADLPRFFADQTDPAACALAGFTPRARSAFDAHWARLLADPSLLVRAVLYDGELVGNVVAWSEGAERLVGYWITRSRWNRGIATRALAAFLELERTRPLHARVALHNVASQRALTKCGFHRVGADGPHELVFALEQ